MNYALIGCGVISSYHIQAAIFNNLNIIAICDIDTNKALALKEKYNLNKTIIFKDYRDLINNKINLDFVAIAVDNGEHYKLCKFFLEHKLNVLLEKPIAMDIKQAQELLNIAKKNSLLLGICFQNRFNDSSQLIKKILIENKLGKISHISISVRWCRDKKYYLNNSWHGSWNEDGGALLSQCIHGFDLINWFINSEIKQVSAFLSNRLHPYIEIEDLGIGIVKYKNGVIGKFEGTTNTYKKNLEETITIIGEKGTIKLGGLAAEKIIYCDLDDKNIDAFITNQKQYKNVYGLGHRKLYTNYINAILGKEKLLVDGYEGLKTLEMILAFHKSSKSQETISLPLYEGKITDFIEDFKS